MSTVQPDKKTINDMDISQFRGVLVPNHLCAAGFRRVISDIEIMLLSGLSVILDRYECDPNYHFIDTKINYRTGGDYKDEDLICGRNVIYGWIQGRGLEALATHKIWLKSSNHIDISLRKHLCQRIEKVVTEMLEKLENIRSKNKGHLFFMMDRGGTPLQLNREGNLEKYNSDSSINSNFSDLFYVKGMALAATILGDKKRFKESRQFFNQIVKNIDEGKFVSDQQNLNDFGQNNQLFQGCVPHSPWMIGIGALTKFVELTGNVFYTKTGIQYIERIIKYYVNVGNRIGEYNECDMWEYIDDKCQPYIDENSNCISDPGHSIEFVGLALKFIRINEQMGLLSYQNDNTKMIKETLIRILKRNFSNGYLPNNFGIFKSLDLISRCPMDTDMPWWSLPETVRAAIEASQVVGKNEQSSLFEIAKTCYNSFVTHYVKGSLNLMAIPSIDQKGCISNIYPATPDLDPGYHTGLSFIDCLNVLK